MKKIFISVVLIYCITSLRAIASLQTDLEMSYKNYTEALNSNDAEKVRTAMSAHSHMRLKNIVISSKLKYPEDFISIANSKIINLKKTRFLNALEKGPTATCVYYGKGYNYAKALILLQFIKEDGKWKFDDIAEKSNDEIIDKVEKKDLAFISKDYMPSGTAPGVAKEITAVDFPGILNFQVEGYKATVKINGITQEITSNTVFEELVLGGLKKGINYIEVRLVPINMAEKNSIKISINAQLRTQRKEVFRYEEVKPSITFMREFEIN